MIKTISSPPASSGGIALTETATPLLSRITGKAAVLALRLAEAENALHALTLG